MNTLTRNVAGRRWVSRAAAWLAAACLAAVALGADGRASTRAVDGMGLRGVDRFGACACQEARREAAQVRRTVGPERTRAGSFDEALGRDLRNYPPHPFVRYERMTLDLDIPDMNVRRLKGVCTYELTPTGNDLPRLTLRAGPEASMSILGVRLGGGAGSKVSFTHEGESLSIEFAPALRADQTAQVVIDYALTDPPEGLIWTPESPAWPGRPAQLHSQGQPESNHFWFPCHDFPNVRMGQEVRVRAPRGYQVSSNGLLKERKELGAQEEFHWVLAGTHVPYLASLVVGKFDVITLRGTEGAGAGQGAGAGGWLAEVYAPPGRREDAIATFGRTPAMMKFFSEFTGQPYPWERYAQLVVHNFGSGGMENTSATTLYDTAVFDDIARRDGDLDGLISHELAHQWFGDLVTCNSWEHIWLNEGFATFCTQLWMQHRDGDDAYLKALWETRRRIVAADQSDPPPAPFRPGMCSKEYAHPWEVFRRASNPYGKGALVLHMLREKLGEENFRLAVGAYVQRRAFKTAETADLMRTMEEVSGQSLEEFFEQWCFRPGTPRLSVKPVWDESSRTLRIGVEQTQPLDGWNPAFTLDVPVAVRAGGAWGSVVVALDGRSGQAELVLPSQPEVVAVDPRVAVLAEIRVEQPLERWLAQLEQGPTVAARLQAIEAITDWSTPAQPGFEARVEEALAARVLGDGGPNGSGGEAAAGLGFLGRTERLLALAGRMDQLQSNATRSAVVAGLAQSATSQSDKSLRRRVIRELAGRVEEPGSYVVRTAALAGLGLMKAEDQTPVILAATRQTSQHDAVRQTALEVLAELDRREGLAPALAAAMPGNLSRTRAAAIAALGRLHRHDPDGVMAMLMAGIRDSEQRMRKASCEALAALGDEQARPLILSVERESLSRADRAMATQCLKDLDEAIGRKAEAGQAVTGAGAETPKAAVPPPVKPKRDPMRGFKRGRPLPVGAGGAGGGAGSGGGGG